MAKTKREIQRDYEKRTGYAAQRKYDAANNRQYRFALNKKTDADLIAHLDALPNKTGYLKKLIRKDIAKENK